MENEYVLLAVFNGNSVLILEKDRPAWQAGRLNLLGGKIEEGETWKDAAIRELHEESGYIATGTRLAGKILAGTAEIYCVEMSIDPPQLPPQPREGETEIPFWADAEGVLRDPRLHDNLKTIIPMMKFRSPEWVIRMNENDFSVEFEKTH